MAAIERDRSNTAIGELRFNLITCVKAGAPTFYNAATLK